MSATTAGIIRKKILKDPFEKFIEVLLEHKKSTLNEVIDPDNQEVLDGLIDFQKHLEQPTYHPTAYAHQLEGNQTPMIY